MGEWSLNASTSLCLPAYLSLISDFSLLSLSLERTNKQERFGAYRDVAVSRGRRHGSDDRRDETRAFAGWGEEGEGAARVEPGHQQVHTAALAAKAEEHTAALAAAVAEQGEGAASALESALAAKEADHTEALASALSAKEAEHASALRLQSEEHTAALAAKAPRRRTYTPTTPTLQCPCSARRQLLRSKPRRKGRSPRSVENLRRS